jgi:squalene cyclase
VPSYGFFIYITILQKQKHEIICEPAWRQRKGIMNYYRFRHIPGVILLFLTITLFFFSPNPPCYAQPIDEGLAWLKMQQNPDGTWGTEIIRETATVVEVLKLLDDTGIEYSNGLTFLEGLSPELVDGLSRKITSISFGGSDVSTEVDQLIRLQNDDGGFGFEEDFPSSLIDTLLAAKALASGRIEDHQIIGKLLYYLTEQQNDDGSFGFVEGGDGSLYLTALAIPILNVFQPRYNLTSYIEIAISYILGFKQADDGFGEVGSSAIETALAVCALIEASGSHNDILQARQYLIVGQQGNGSWDNDAYATALAVLALFILLRGRLFSLAVRLSMLV